MNTQPRGETRFPVPERSWRRTTVTYLWVALGGVIGALARHGAAAAGDALLGHDVPGTFFANITGAFLLGYFSTITSKKVQLPIDVRRFVGVGILGSYTTFSVLSYQTLELVEGGELVLAAGYSAGSLITGLVAVAAGVRLARR